MISLINVMGIIGRWKTSIIRLRLRFLEISHKNIWVSWGVLFKGLSVQKGTQMPCWLRPCLEVTQGCPWYLWNQLLLLIWIILAVIVGAIDISLSRMMHLLQKSISQNRIVGALRRKVISWVAIAIISPSNTFKMMLLLQKYPKNIQGFNFLAAGG